MPASEQVSSNSMNMRFAAAAVTYHRLAKIQRLVAAELVTLLSAKIPVGFFPKRILEVGCGTGILTRMLGNIFPFAGIDAIDSAQSIAQKARRLLQNKENIKVITADALRMQNANKYQLVASSSALHWVRPIAEIINKLETMLKAEGIFAAAIMTRGTFKELNASKRRVAARKRSRVILPSVVEIRKALAQNHLCLLAEKTASIKEYFQSPELFLRKLHEQGLTGGNMPGRSQFLTRLELKRLAEDYRTHYYSGKDVYATYRVYYCIAQKKTESNLNQHEVRRAHRAGSARFAKRDITQLAENRSSGCAAAYHWNKSQ